MKIDAMLIGGIIAGLLLGGVGGYLLSPKTDVTSLEQRILTLESTAQQNQNQIHDLQVQTAEYEDEITVMTGQLEQAGVDYSTLESDYSELEEDTQQLINTLSTKNSELAGLYTDIGSLQTQVNSLQEQITILEELSLTEVIAVSFSATGNTEDLLVEWVNKADETILLMVNRIVAGNLSEALIDAYSRGVQVQVIIDTDERYTQGSAFTELLTVGIDIRGDNNLHQMNNKAMIVDNQIVATGSYDWTPNAEVTQDNNVIFLENELVTGFYVSEFERIWNLTIPETVISTNPATYIIINEVEMNPVGSDATNEWVELFNPTNVTVDISLWWVMATSGTPYGQYIEWGTEIGPGEYYVLHATQQWMDNPGDMIQLMNYEQVIVDYTPGLSEFNETSYTWQRIPNGYDSDSASDWFYAEATQGEENTLPE